MFLVCLFFFAPRALSAAIINRRRWFVLNCSNEPHQFWQSVCLLFPQCLTIISLFRINFDFFSASSCYNLNFKLAKRKWWKRARAALWQLLLTRRFSPHFSTFCAYFFYVMRKYEINQMIIICFSLLWLVHENLMEHWTVQIIEQPSRIPGVVHIYTHFNANNPIRIRFQI